MKRLLLLILRYATLPLAVLYGLIVWLRNKLYDWGVSTAIGFNLPVISVGNLTVGGTGKTPHIEYLIELLLPDYKVATLSRGYRRRTRGFILANENTTAHDIGDEPFQYHAKFPSLTVCVAEERMTAIPQLLQRKPNLNIILLDDAFQHRSVKPGLNILLCDYNRMYTRDYIMPFGLLRESRRSAARANIIVVSKCPSNLSETERDALVREIAPLPHQPVFFSTMAYTRCYPLGAVTVADVPEPSVLLVTGIAQPESLLALAKSRYGFVHHLAYKDHHYFTRDDVDEMKAAFDHLPGQHKLVLTTEKDAARLQLIRELLEPLQWPIYVQAIGVEMLFNQQAAFNEHIAQFLAPYFTEPEPEPEHVDFTIIDPEIM